MIDIRKTFEKLEEQDCGDFKDIENPLHPRHDICAFLFLHKLQPNDWGIIEGASHDVIWLNTNIEELEKVATEEDILYLRRCRVRMGEDWLEMAV